LIFRGQAILQNFAANNPTIAANAIAFGPPRGNRTAQFHAVARLTGFQAKARESGVLGHFASYGKNLFERNFDDGSLICWNKVKFTECIDITFAQILKKRSAL
jgi:hypothetical protein